MGRPGVNPGVIRVSQSAEGSAPLSFHQKHRISQKGVTYQFRPRMRPAAAVALLLPPSGRRRILIVSAQSVAHARSEQARRAARRVEKCAKPRIERLRADRGSKAHNPHQALI